MISHFISFLLIFSYLFIYLKAQLTNIRNIVDAVGLVWFVVGNMWIFGDDR